MWDGKCSGHGLVKLIDGLNRDDLIGLEIGCSLGDTTEYLLKNFDKLQLFGIDPYEEYVDWNGNYLGDMEGCINQFYQKVSPYSNRFTLYRDFSDNVVGKFEDGVLDFVFIDGLHTYEQVLADCRNYYSKVKSGGIFAGHDFNVIEAVNRAVKEFAAEVEINEILETEVDVWYWIKP